MVVDANIERRDSIIYKNREIEVTIPLKLEFGWSEKKQVCIFIKMEKHIQYKPLKVKCKFVFLIKNL